MDCAVCTRPIRSSDTVCPYCHSPVLDPSDQPTVHEPSAGLLPGALFAGRFTIVERAHEGGMGVVYKALDNQLRETVALKLIRPQFAASYRFAERFRREVRLTRHITHPNVCRVHDLGEFEGTLYLSMQWIRGETLAQLIRKARRLDLDRALEIAQKICAALAAAHAAGVIHRDLKPGNVMIDEKGEVIVVDFGLAAEIGPDAPSRPSFLGGTPLYMAPEQALGETVDERADLYALGLVFREMLTGSPRGSATAPSTTSPARYERALGLVERLTQEDPRHRPATAEEVSTALTALAAPPAELRQSGTRRLERVLAPAAGAALAALLTWYFFLRPPDPSDPMKDLVTPADAYYQRGLVYMREESGSPEDLETAIAMFFRSVTKDSTRAEAWAALGESYWIRFDWTNEESSKREAEAAVERALAIDPQSAAARTAGARGFLAEGRHEEAKAELQQVVARAPESDIAWEYLGRSYQGLGEYGAGLQALRRAIELDPRSAQHQNILGNFHQRFDEYDAAIAAYRRAIDLKPESIVAWNNLGTVYLRQGSFEEAARAFEECLRFRADADAESNLGSAYYYSGKYADAVTHYQRATALKPGSAANWGNLGDGLTAAGKPDDAKRAFAEAARLARQEVAAKPRDAEAHKLLAMWCARAGDAECALSEARLAASIDPDNADIQYETALIHCLLGLEEEALPWLERAVRLGVSGARIRAEPEFRRLGGEKRFERILELAG